MALYLIRHGETAGNAEHIVQQPDVPLNLRGQRQARRLAARLAATPPARILTSDYARAHMTAEQIQIASGAELQVEPLLRERNFGDLRGRPHAEIGDLYAPDLIPPNGESWDMFHARIDRAWQTVQDVLNGIDGNLAVVTHGLVCYSLAAHHLQLPAGQEARMNFLNTSLTEVEPRSPWRVLVFNSTTHLDGEDTGAALAGGV